MGTYLERLEILINANSAGAVKGLGQTTEAALGTEVATSKLGKAMIPIVGTTIAVGAALYSTVKAYDEAHRSVIQLDNSIKGNINLVPSMKQGFLDLADSLQQKTAADGDAIVSGMAMLATFRLTKDEMTTLTPLMVDYAQKNQVDMVSAAKQVGKAMDGQVSALRRNGVNIDVVRFKTDRYGAIVSALRENVGGFAEQEGKTFSGRLETLKNNLGDVQEAIGGELAPALTTMVNAAIGGIGAIGDLTSAIGGLATVGKYVTYAVLGPFYGTAYAMVQGVNLLGDALSDLSGGSFNAVANSTKEYRRYLESMGLSQDEVNAKIKEFEANQRKAQAATDGSAGALQQQEKALRGVVDALFAKINADLAAEGSLLAVESAQNSYNKSLTDNGAGALETRQALVQYETAIKTAAEAAGKAAQQAAGPDASDQEKARAGYQAQIETLINLSSNAAPAAQAAMREYIRTIVSTPTYWSTLVWADTSQATAAINALIQLYNNVPTGFGVVTPAGIAASRGMVLGLDGQYHERAAGGPVQAGRPYLIGERGPELMVPNSSGTVVPNNRLGAQSSYSVNVTVNAGMGSDPGQIGAAVVDSIKAYERRSGNAWRSN